MNCPACSYYNPPSSVTCAHCTLPLLPSVGAAVCAVHAGVTAMGACGRCGTFGCGSCLSQRGADWLCAPCLGLVSKLPWDERANLGLWRAWWRTSVAILSAPNDTLRHAEADGSVGSSVVFTLLSTVVGYTPTLLLNVPAALLANDEVTKAGGGDISVRLGTAVGQFLFWAIFLLFFELGTLFAVAGLEHLGLKMIGPTKSYTVTLRAHALSKSAYLIGLVPLCSLYVHPVWSIVLRIFAALQLHKTTPGHATAGILLPITLLCGCLFTFYASVIALAAGFAH